jgi:hypothetical protein
MIIRKRKAGSDSVPTQSLTQKYNRGIVDKDEAKAAKELPSY